MDIGKRMKELRVFYGLTQQELADRAELTKGFISQLERNQNTPSVSTLLDIIQCLPGGIFRRTGSGTDCIQKRRLFRENQRRAEKHY